MRKNKNGFVVSAVLYPLLVLFLALIMGLLAMTDTRKRILDKMKLEISDSIFDDAECSCDTILNKLNYLIKNGVGGGGNGSYGFNVLGLNVKGYETPDMFPNTGNAVGDIAVLTDTEVTDYYVSQSAPGSPKEGNVWIVQDITSTYHITSDYSNIGISYAMQYIEGKWVLKKAYVYDEAKWNLLYYVSLKDDVVDLTSSDINAETKWEYDYTGEYQTFTARFSGYYQVELWGAQGGNSGGKGAYTKGEIYLDAGQKLYIYVGQQGSTYSGKDTSCGSAWNGGGVGCGQTDPASRTFGSGGGATDVRLVNTSEKNVWNEFESLKSRIMVAAGGGGAYNGSGGGPGGGLVGYDAATTNGYGPGSGATQTLATMAQFMTVANTGYIESTSGDFGLGGSSSGKSTGGGGGYYGGSSSHHIDSAGGGSSYISGYEGCNSLDESSTATNLLHTGSAYHYSGHYFINGIMLDGKSLSVPTYDGTKTMTGNAGNGHALITLKSIFVKDKDSKQLLPYHYSFSNTYQIFEVEKSGNYQIELWGAQGGNSGGAGAYTQGEITLEKGTKLYIYVGELGKKVVNVAKFIEGGWNGGGNIGGQAYQNRSWGSGGGATDVRLVPTVSIETWNEVESLKSRIMVAAGGGGACNGSGGGPGGGLVGYDATTTNGYGPGKGGKQASGNSVANYPNTESGFGFGGGGSGAVNGGGSGWYGGTSSGHVDSAGGGSSYISGHAGCIAINTNGNPKVQTYTTLADSISYTGYKFTNTVMIDGRGYPWTTEKSPSSSGMPSPTSSSLVTGHAGDGYAKITYLGES